MNPYLIGGAILATLAVIAAIYLKGQESGQSEIKTKVQTETIRTLEQARQSKAHTDEEVLRTPYDDRVDGLR